MRHSASGIHSPSSPSLRNPASQIQFKWQALSQAWSLVWRENNFKFQRLLNLHYFHFRLTFLYSYSRKFYDILWFLIRIPRIHGFLCILSQILMEMLSQKWIKKRFSLLIFFHNLLASDEIAISKITVNIRAKVTVFMVLMEIKLKYSSIIFSLFSISSETYFDANLFIKWM